ncbi:MAG: glycerophosphodiester phosphodiesterase [Bacteroidia bacterium]
MRKLILLLCFSYLHGFAQTLVIAHRGASNSEPENSLSAFEKAIACKADYIETDVHQTADGEVVIMHDLSVNRTCTIEKNLRDKHGKKILIKDLSKEEFLSLKIKNTQESPPTLDEAIKLINGRCKLLIELKKGNDYYPAIEQHILQIIKDNNAAEWVNVIHSFDKNALLEINRQNTGMKLQKLIVFKLPLTSFNFSKKLNKDKFENWQGVNTYYFFTHKKLVRKLHKQGKTVFAWTVNKRRVAKRMISIGVDGVITNKPEMVRELLSKNN